MPRSTLARSDAIRFVGDSLNGSRDTPSPDWSANCSRRKGSSAMYPRPVLMVAWTSLPGKVGWGSTAPLSLIFHRG